MDTKRPIASMALAIACILATESTAAEPGPYTIAKLPYAYDALEPWIDARTVRLHHDKHFGAAVDGLNKAVAGAPELSSMPVEELLGNLDRVPEGIRTAVTNNAGSVAAHSLYFQGMGRHRGGVPKGEIGDAINAAFGDFAKFKEEFTAAGVGLFASGWTWLVDDHGTLAIVTTSGHGSPLTAGQTPLLVLDVWEHAYYLKYQNRRADYVAAWWHLVNWDEVGRRLKAARAAAGPAAAPAPEPAPAPASGD